MFYTTMHPLIFCSLVVLQFSGFVAKLLFSGFVV